jgi:PilZ domain-containing protein
VTPDPSLAACFAAISKELGIAVEASKVPVGVPMELGRDKYEAFLVDFDAVPDATPTLAAVRTSPSNHGAVVFAMATGQGKKELALSHGANFILERPIDARDMRRKLYAAYDVMSQERRRYFRCTAEVPVFITRSNGSVLTCKTANVSANGLSITSTESFAAGERIEIALQLEPNTEQIRGNGTVVWDDKHGKTGVSLQGVATEDQARLDFWLDDHFANLRRHLPTGTKEDPAAVTTAGS